MNLVNPRLQQKLLNQIRNPEMNEEGLPEESQELSMIRQLQRCYLNITQQDELQRKQCINAMYQNSQMFNQIRLLLQFVRQLKQSFKIEKQNLSIPKQGDGAQIKKIPELVIKQVKNIRRVNEENIVCVANKLKVFVSKTMQIESSKLKYNYNSYTSLLSDEILFFKFSNPIEKIREQFQKIRKTFNIVSVNAARLHRHHPSERVLSQNMFRFYASFYIENLLFFQDQPLPFNGNILFAPLILGKVKSKQTGKSNYVHISPIYIHDLYRQNESWETLCLQLIFRDKLTNEVKHYYCATYQKRGIQSDACSLLRKIRTYVYFSLLFNFLKCTIVQNDNSIETRRSLIIQLRDNLMLEINTERQIYDEDAKANVRLFQDFLKYFEQENMKKRTQTNKMEVLNNFVNYIHIILCKIKHEAYVSQEYLSIRPKYIYKGNRRIQV